MLDIVVALYGDYTGCVGQIIDAAEYYMYFKHSGFNCKFIITCGEKTLNLIDGLYEEKYNVKIDYTHWNYQRIYNFNTNILFFPSVHMTADFLRKCYPRAKTILTTRCVPDYIDYETQTCDEEYLSTQPYNIMVLEDRRLYSKRMHVVSFNHKRKPYFKIIKEPKKIERRTLVMLNEFREVEPKELEKHIKKDGGPFLLLVQSNDYDNLKSDKVELEYAPIQNFQERFDTLIYFPHDRKFDPSPRVPAECVYFGKKIKIIDFHKLSERKDGAFYRFIDISNNIESLNLENDTDLIVLVKGLL